MYEVITWHRCAATSDVATPQWLCTVKKNTVQPACYSTALPPRHAHYSTTNLRQPLLPTHTHYSPSPLTHYKPAHLRQAPVLPSQHSQSLVQGSSTVHHLTCFDMPASDSEGWTDAGGGVGRVGEVGACRVLPCSAQSSPVGCHEHIEGVLSGHPRQEVAVGCLLQS